MNDFAFSEMDQGHFLTNSGSKIPMPKSRKDVAVVAPLKPKLAVCKTTTTNFKPESCDGLDDNFLEETDNVSVSKPKPRVATNRKSTKNNVKLIYLLQVLFGIHLHYFIYL